MNVQFREQLRVYVVTIPGCRKRSMIIRNKIVRIMDTGNVVSVSRTWSRPNFTFRYQAQKAMDFG